MKHLKFAMIFTLLTSGLIGGILLPTNAETVPQTVPQSVINALAYPTSSQRFLEEGYRRMEMDIRQLQEPAPATPVLSVDPDLEQLDLQQWQPWNEDPLPSEGDRLPTESYGLPTLPQQN